ncbi:uncharacterized protein [Ptychodera flava]|uniref:uncharacterized protein n=1 Tax=Ptychodera flava TaxID=63121 RepID=UPI00396A0726
MDVNQARVLVLVICVAIRCATVAGCARNVLVQNSAGITPAEGEYDGIFKQNTSVVTFNKDEITMKYRHCLCKRTLTLSEVNLKGVDVFDVQREEEADDLTDEEFKILLASSKVRKRRSRVRRSAWPDGAGHTYIEYQGIVFDFSADNLIKENREPPCCDDDPIRIGYSACSLEQVRALNRKWQSFTATRQYKLLKNNCQHFTTTLSRYLNDDCIIKSQDHKVAP